MEEGQRWKSIPFLHFARSLLLIYSEIQMPDFYQMHTAHSFNHFLFSEPSLQLIKLSLCDSRLSTLLLPIWCCCFISCYLFLSHVSVWNKIRCPSFTARFIFSRCRRERKWKDGRERERSLFWCGGSWWHSNEPWPAMLTQSYVHTSAHTIYASSYCFASPFQH